MAKTVSTDVIDTPQGKRLRVSETRIRQRVLTVEQVQRTIAGMDQRIGALQDEATELQTERDDLASKLTQLQAAQAKP